MVGVWQGFVRVYGGVDAYNMRFERIHPSRLSPAIEESKLVLSGLAVARPT